MKYSRRGKFKTTSVVSILAGLGALVLIQLAGSAVAAAMVGQGSITEESMSLVAAVIRGVGLASGGMVSWWLSPEKKITDASITVGSGLILPLVAALLFWEVDALTSMINAGISIAAFFGCVWVFSRPKKAVRWRSGKKGYC